MSDPKNSPDEAAALFPLPEEINKLKDASLSNLGVLATSAIIYSASVIMSSVYFSKKEDRSGFTSFSVPVGFAIDTMFCAWLLYKNKQFREAVNAVKPNNYSGKTEAGLKQFAGELLRDSSVHIPLITQMSFFAIIGTITLFSSQIPHVVNQLYGGLVVLSIGLITNLIIEAWRQKDCGSKRVLPSIWGGLCPTRNFIADDDSNLEGACCHFTA